MRYERKSTEEEIENRFIPWLEKQGERKEIDYNEELKKCRANPLYFFDKYVKVKLNERKPADKVEPKFNAGDWIVYNDDLYHIGNIALRGYYECLRIDGTVHTFSLDIDSKSHLWTIRDAKDGDVLAWDNSECIAIFKNIHDGESFCSYGYVGACTKVFETGISYHDIKGAHPATKEQRDLLFTKMKEAGYEWDAEKKELKKIEETNPAENTCKISDCVEKVDMTEYNKGFECGKQRVLKYPEDFNLYEKSDSAWNEEDEEMFDAIIADIQFTRKAHNYAVNQVVYESEIDWLKSIKERVRPQSKKELSEDAATNEYVDLGLPSGTLWKAFSEEGYCTYDEVLNKFDNRLPSKEQWKELKDECEWEWKDNGYDVTGPNGNMIFLPAVGYRDCTGLNLVGRYGYYWSSTGAGDKGAWCMKFDDGGFNYLSKENRCIGFSVRLVK